MFAGDGVVDRSGRRRCRWRRWLIRRERGIRLRGASMGIWRRRVSVTPAVFKRALFYGGVMGSFAVERFGTERLQGIQAGRRLRTGSSCFWRCLTWRRVEEDAGGLRGRGSRCDGGEARSQVRDLGHPVL